MKWRSRIQYFASGRTPKYHAGGLNGLIILQSFTQESYLSRESELAAPANTNTEVGADVGAKLCDIRDVFRNISI